MYAFIKYFKSSVLFPKCSIFSMTFLSNVNYVTQVTAGSKLYPFHINLKNLWIFTYDLTAGWPRGSLRTLILSVQYFFKFQNFEMIPVLDISPFLEASKIKEDGQDISKDLEEKVKKLTGEIYEACCFWGVFQVVGHGVPIQVQQDLLRHSRVGQILDGPFSCDKFLFQSINDRYTFRCKILYLNNDLSYASYSGLIFMENCYPV